MTKDQINKICALFCGLEYQEGWWCEKCQSFVDGRQVTYQENHEEFVNRLRENVVAYLRYALDNGMHRELFKEKCKYAQTWPRVGKRGGDALFCQHECGKGDKENCSGTIDTPLAKVVREVKE
jgi:hypothetical protein